MKKYLLSMLALMLVVFAFAGAYTIGTGTTGSYTAPFNGLYDNNWSKSVYTLAEINAAGLTSANSIIGIGLNVTNTPANYAMNDQRVYVRHSDVTNYTDTSHPNSADFHTGFIGTLTYNGGGWFHITFATPFAWNGTQGLEFLFENRDGSWTSGYPNFAYTSTSPNYRMVNKAQDSSFPQGVAGSTSYNRPNIQLITPMVDPPAPAVMQLPPNGATMVSVYPSLTWQGSMGATGYKLYMGTTNPPAFVADLGNVTSYNASGLLFNTTYYWQIVPYNTYGNATGCPVWSFTTVPPGLVSIGNGMANNMLPVYPYYGYTYSQSIFLQSEINMPNQRIEKIYYYWNGAGVGANSNEWVVYVGHTNNSTFASGTSWIPLSELTQVYAGTLNLPATPGWIEIILQNPFVYNNTQNLVIAVDENKPSYDSSTLFFYSTVTTGQNRSLRYYEDSTNPNPASPPTGTQVAAIPNILLQFGDLPANPIFSYNPASINFGQVLHGSPSVPQNVMVANTGAGILNLAASNISLIGPNAAEFSFGTSNLPAALGPGQSVMIPVTVTANTEGAISATMRMVYNSTNYDVALSATGLPAGLIIIGNGTATQRQPFNHYFGYERSAAIYTPAQYGAPGMITQAGWYCDQASTAAVPYKIYAGTTTNTAFTASTWDSMIAGLTLVKQGNHTFSSTGWVLFELDTPFMLSGGNLIFAIESNYGGGGTSPYPMFRYTASDAGRHQYWYADTNPPATAGTLNSQLPNLMMQMAAATGPAVAPILSYPANGATGLPVGGFNLTWSPDLVNGGMPDFYAVYMSTNEDDIFADFYDETSNAFYNPVTEGGLTFSHSQRWYWAVQAVNAQGDGVSGTRRFDIIAAPPQISVNPAAMTANLEVGDVGTQVLTITNNGGLPLNYNIGFAETPVPAPVRAQIGNIVPNPNAHLMAEMAPNAGAMNVESSRALYDLQFAFEPTSGTGEYGVVYADGFIYTSQWNTPAGSCNFYKYDLDGTLLQTINIPGVNAVRDFTYDGTHFYGAANSTTIYKFDLSTATLLGTITAPVAARGITYDPEVNGLWITNGWNAPLTLLAMDGTTLRTLNTAAANLAGIAYDGYSGDPAIWANTQNGTTRNTLSKIDVSTGTVLGSYAMDQIFPFLDTESSAGGINIATGIVPGFATILGTAQNEVIYGLELCPVAAWAIPNPRMGVVAPGASVNVDINFNTAGLAAGEYHGALTIRHNAPTPEVQVPLTLTITGDWLPVFNIAPDTWSFGDVEQHNPATKQFTITNSGGPGLDLDGASFYLTNNAEGNFQIQANGLPVSLGYNENYRFDVVFTPVSLGAKTAILNIVDGLTRQIHQIPLSGVGVVEPIGQVVNLQATVQNVNNVLLTWGVTSAEPGTPGWLHYDNGTNLDGIGTGAVANFDVAIKFTGADLWNYAGMRLEKVKFFPRSGNTNYAVRIWTGSDGSMAPTTLVYSQPVVSPIIDAWNEIILTTPYPLVQGQALWIGYNCDVLDGTQFHPAGCDAGPAVVGKGDLIALGGNWVSMATQYSLNYNWNLQAYVNDAPAPGPMMANWLKTPVISRSLSKEQMRTLHLETSGMPNPPQRVLRGFNVYRNNTQINTALVTAPTYLDQGLADGSYTYTVQGVYYSQTTALSAPATAVITSPAPLAIPFNENWDSNNFTQNMWAATGDNWSVGSTGNPAPAAQFSWNPQVVDYDMPLTSYNINGTGISNIQLSFDLNLNNYSLDAENIMYWEVFNGSTWQTIGSYSSMNGSLGWTNIVANISAHAANRIFKIRFRAAGEDSYEINYWYIDNIQVIALPPATLDPVTDLTAVLTDTGITLNWTQIPGAEWYVIYGANDPYGTYLPLTSVGAVGSVSFPFSVLDTDKKFVKITAGNGPIPTF